PAAAALAGARSAGGTTVGRGVAKRGEVGAGQLVAAVSEGPSGRVGVGDRREVTAADADAVVARRAARVGADGGQLAGGVTEGGDRAVDGRHRGQVVRLAVAVGVDVGERQVLVAVGTLPGGHPAAAAEKPLLPLRR